MNSLQQSFRWITTSFFFSSKFGSTCMLLRISISCSVIFSSVILRSILESMLFLGLQFLGIFSFSDRPFWLAADAFLGPAETLALFSFCDKWLNASFEHPASVFLFTLFKWSFALSLVAGRNLIFCTSSIWGTFPAFTLCWRRSPMFRGLADWEPFRLLDWLWEAGKGSMGVSPMKLAMPPVKVSWLRTKLGAPLLFML